MFQTLTEESDDAEIIFKVFNSPLNQFTLKLCPESTYYGLNVIKFQNTMV